MKIPGIVIILFLILAGCIKSYPQDSVSVAGKGNEVPEWLQAKIKEMSIDEKHYGGTKIFKYEIDSVDIYWINNPWSSCMYCELYNSDGTRLNKEATNKFMKEKDEPILIWQNLPAVRFDSLKKNIQSGSDED